MTALTPNDYEILFKSSAWQALPADDRAQPLEEHILATTKSHDALPAQKTNKHTSRHHCSAAEDQTFESYVKKVRQGFEDLLRTNLFRNKDVDISNRGEKQALRIDEEVPNPGYSLVREPFVATLNNEEAHPELDNAGAKYGEVEQDREGDLVGRNGAGYTVHHLTYAGK